MNAEAAAKTWLITDCSSGLGRALAAHVLARGGRVVATARCPGQLAFLADAYPTRWEHVGLPIEFASSH